MEPWPPALLLFERERKEERKREKFYIYSDVKHTHTLAQKHLIELLMWNASHVQKNNPVKSDRNGFDD